MRRPPETVTTDWWVDRAHVLHDHTVPSPLATFNNDYATGKGIFMRHALGVARATNNQKLKDCIFASARHAWNTAAVGPDGSRLFRFAWNDQGKLPSGSWDTTDHEDPSPLRTIILQASGLDALSTAAALDPLRIIDEHESDGAGPTSRKRMVTHLPRSRRAG